MIKYTIRVDIMTEGDGVHFVLADLASKFEECTMTGDTAHVDFVNDDGVKLACVNILRREAVA